MSLSRQALLLACALAEIALATLPRGVAAQEADTSAAPPAREPRRCAPSKAFALGLVVPGGGQFYLGDISGGIQAVATDVVLFEALRRSGSTARGIAIFLGSVHFVEGLFAAQACRAKNARPRPAPAVPAQADQTACGPLQSQLVRGPSRTPPERWRVALSVQLSLAGS